MVYVIAVDDSENYEDIVEEFTENFYRCVLHTTNKKEAEEFIQFNHSLDGLSGEDVLETEFNENETCPVCGRKWL